MCSLLQSPLFLQAGPLVFLQLIDWLWGPLEGSFRPWWIVVTSLTWWGLWSTTWGHNTRKCRAHGFGGSDSTCFQASCLDRPSAYPAKSASCRPLSAWGLGLTGYIGVWSLQSSQAEVLISYHPFECLFGQTFSFFLDEDRLAFLFSSVCPFGQSLHLQHSSISWPCIAYFPSSSSRSCRWRRWTLQIATSWWTRWLELCRRLRQSKWPPYWSGSHTTLGFRLPAA